MRLADFRQLAPTANKQLAAQHACNTYGNLVGIEDDANRLGHSLEVWGKASCSYFRLANQVNCTQPARTTGWSLGHSSQR